MPPPRTESVSPCLLPSPRSTCSHAVLTIQHCRGRQHVAVPCASFLKKRKFHWDIVMNTEVSWAFIAQSFTTQSLAVYLTKDREVPRGLCLFKLTHRTPESICHTRKHIDTQCINKVRCPQPSSLCAKQFRLVMTLELYFNAFGYLRLKVSHLLLTEHSIQRQSYRKWKCEKRWEQSHSPHLWSLLSSTEFHAHVFVLWFMCACTHLSDSV